MMRSPWQPCSTAPTSRDPASKAISSYRPQYKDMGPGCPLYLIRLAEVGARIRFREVCKKALTPDTVAWQTIKAVSNLLPLLPDLLSGEIPPPHSTSKARRSRLNS